MSARATATISTVLVDDEALALGELSYLLKDFAGIEVVATASDGLKAIEIIQDIEPDLVFLDVQMPGLDGLGVIRKLRENGANLPYFVLATAWDQYAVEAFRLEAMDYLLKPVEKERLAGTVERARRALDEKGREPPEPSAKSGPPRSKILIRSGPRNIIVDAQDIVYVTIDGGLISIVTQELEGTSNYRTIEEMQADLDPDVFWRVHRSYLVNIHRIREVLPWFKSSFQLKLDDRKRTVVPVSRVQTRRLRELLKL